MSINIKLLNIVMLLIAVFSLSFAYYVEYIMQLAACPLCIYQRFPFLIFMMIAISGIASGCVNNIYYLLTSIANMLLALYHTGVERQLFMMSSFCKPLVSTSASMSASDFKNMLYSKPLGMCNKPAIKIFELSMAEWNLLLSFILSLLFAILIFNNLKKKK